VFDFEEMKTYLRGQIQNALSIPDDASVVHAADKLGKILFIEKLMEERRG